MKLRFLPQVFSFFFLVLTLSALPLSGQTVLAGWDMDPLPGGANNFGPSPFSPSTSNANVGVTGLTRGVGILSTGTMGGTNAWGGTSFNSSSPSFATAISDGEYVTFSIQPNNGYQFSISEIAAYNIRRSNTGPTMGQWQYSLDGTSFTDIGTAITWGSTTSAAGNSQSAIDLSGITDLQNVEYPATVTFRIVIWGAAGSTGTWYINDPSGTPGDDFIVNASEVTTLPIQLLFFEPQKAGQTTLLSWATDSEHNNDFMAVERSKDGRIWAEIGRLQGAGTTLDRQFYNFTDYTPFNGLNYYRLRQVDFDGKFTIHKVVAVDFRPEQPGLNLFPTLVQDELTVQLPQPAEQPAQISIWNQLGQSMGAFTLPAGQPKMTLPLHNLASGPYIVQVKVGNDIVSGIFVKN